MAKSNVRRGDKGAGSDFVNQQRAMDEAMNERVKENNENEKLNPEWLENKNRMSYKPDVSEKKSGHSKH